jgi:hypothetical protein
MPSGTRLLPVVLAALLLIGANPVGAQAPRSDYLVLATMKTGTMH